MSDFTKGLNSIIIPAYESETYLRECLTKQISTGMAYDPPKSRAFIQKYGRGEYTVLLCHDE